MVNFKLTCVFWCFLLLITDWHNVTCFQFFTAQKMWNFSQALSYLLFFSSPDHSLWSLTTNSTNQCRPGCQQKVLPGVLQCPSIVNNLQTVVSHCKQEVVCYPLSCNTNWGQIRTDSQKNPFDRQSICFFVNKSFFGISINYWTVREAVNFEISPCHTVPKL